MEQIAFTLQTQTGAYDLDAHVQRIGEDFLVAIWGGEKPHIGAVAVAQPRPSLKNPNLTSASVSVFCFVSHKEDDLAKAVSEIMAAALKTNVVVTAGIHWDDLEAGAIRKVVQNSEILVDLILKKITSLQTGKQ